MATLPTGTGVTFLFTDIQGSTRLAQDHPAAWVQIVERHAGLLRKAVAAHDGTEVRTEGDAFFVAFSTAHDAVEAAAQAQRALAGEDWPDGTRVSVRMGLHTGEGVAGGDDYIGLDVHRAARIAGAGHGGQVLLSQSTRDLVADELPAGLRLRDLGAHRLKDLARSERIHQLDIDGLPHEFPVLLTLEGHANNLPVQLTSFLGRDRDVAALSGLVRESPLVTLTGAGGSGKTRLAQQVAAELLDELDDGAFFVDLATLTAADMVEAAIASALGLAEAPGEPLLETMAGWLSGRRMLLVLDNFEHVLAAAGLLPRLLQASSELRILVTSRRLLDIEGEREHVVPPLAVADSMRLFVDRAKAVRPTFRLTDEAAPIVAEIVSRLDGLPLAVELAAARVRLLTVHAIRERLDDRLDFIGSTRRDLPARQQTLRATIEWSHALLGEAEQALFRRLAVFSGTFDVDAAQEVCRPSELGLDCVDALTSLAAGSLLRQEETETGEPRLRMLETIHEFALEQLAGSDDLDDVRRRHASWFLGLARAAEPRLTSSAEVVDRLGHDHDNVRAALAWALETGDAETGLELGHAMWRFWHLRGHLREGREWFDQLLALPSAAAPTPHRAKGLTGAAGIAYWQNDYDAAEAWYLEAEEILRRLGDRRQLSDALFNTGSMSMLRGNMDAALEQFAEGLEIARDLGERTLVSRHLEAKGYAAFMTDDLVAARPLLEEGLAMAEQDDDTFRRALAHHQVAQVDRLDGRLDEAARGYRSAIELARGLGAFSGMIEPLEGLAATLVASGRAAEGARILGGVTGIRDRTGGGPPPEWIRLGDPLGDARELLGDQAVDDALARGRELGDDEVAALALNTAG